MSFLQASTRVAVVMPIFQRRFVFLRTYYCSLISSSSFSTCSGTTSSTVTTRRMRGTNSSTKSSSSSRPSKVMHRSNSTTTYAGSSSSSSSNKNNSKPSKSTTPISNRTRLGIGGSNLLLAPSSLEQYASILRTALVNNISTFELSSIDDDSVSGSGEQQAFVKAFQLARDNLESTMIAASNNTTTTISPFVTTVLARFGYRTMKTKPTSTSTTSTEVEVDKEEEVGKEESTVSDFITPKPFFSQDILVSSTTSPSNEENNNSNDSVTIDSNTTSTTTATQIRFSSSLYHNISPEYIHYCLSQSPLVQQKDNYNINLIYMVHNPETQGGAAVGTGGRMTTTTTTTDDGPTSSSAEPLSTIRTVVRDRLKEAFIALERATITNQISSYGVYSNGLSLPSTHPLHLSWKDVIDVAYEAATAVHTTKTTTISNTEPPPPPNTVANPTSSSSTSKDIITPKLSTIQLPANLLEIQGFTVAQQIQDYVTSVNLPLDIFISRPLTCYLDQGVGTAGSYPLKLLDYQMDLPLENADAAATTTTTTTTTTAVDMNTDTNTKKAYPWTHELSEGTMQSLYLPAYNAAMGHFDAESILELQRERPLTVEERETVQGCRLLQQMLYELDKSVQKTKSFHEYEDNLHTKVIPLIHNAFEELDETSTDLLQQFFMAHGAAVRYTIARTTRELLLKGGDGVPPYDIPSNMKLQHFALKNILSRNPAIKIIVGCSKREHVLEAIAAADDDSD